MSKRKRLTALLAVVASFAAIASIAYAAGLSNNTATLPSKNPTGVQKTGGDLRAWAMQIPGSKLEGSATKVTTMPWGDPETVGGGTVTISKYTVKGDTGYVTINVKLTSGGLSIYNCMATTSGGDFGAAAITTTSCKANGYTVKVMFPGQQGTNPSLNMKWYTGVN